MINLIFPLELSVRPPGPIEGFIREVSVNELLECDLVAVWRLQAQPQQEVRTLLALCYGFQGAPEMLMKLFCRHGDWRGPPGSVVIIIIIIIIIDIIIQESVLRLQQGGQPGDRPGRGRQQRGGKEQSHGRGPVHCTEDGGTVGLFLYPASSIYLELPKPVRLLLCPQTRPCVSKVSMFRREDDNFHPLLVTCDLLPHSQ